jgi:cytochrome c-type biogenesis protein CcmH
VSIARRLGIILAVALALAGPASASELHPTLGELENEVYCPTCHTPLAVSHSPIAERMRVYIRARIAAGDTKSEIKDKLVAEFGESVLAAPPAKGFNLLAWMLPIVGGLVAIAVVAVLARRWSRSRPTPAEVAEQSTNGRAIDSDLERRLDEELARFE